MVSETKTKDISVFSFDGMNSFPDPRTILDSEFSYLVNILFKGTSITSRMPYKRIMANTIPGSKRPVGGGVYNSGSTNLIYFGIADGKLYKLADGSSTPVQITLSGSSPLNAGERIDCCQHFGDFFVVDKAKLLYINPSTNTATDLTSKLSASGITAPAFITSWANCLWVADEAGRVVASTTEADVVNDADPFPLGDGDTGFYTPISLNDGLLTSGFSKTNSTLVINKYSKTQKRGAIYTIQGFDYLDFVQKEISSTVGFVGQSATACGSRVLGLTTNKFDFLTTIEKYGSSFAVNTNQTASSFDNGIIEDYIKDIIDDIEFDSSEKVCSAYHPQENAYYCSIPVGDGAATNNLIIRIDLTNGKIRMSLFTNAHAQEFFYFMGYMHFIDDRANIWRMEDDRQATKDSGYEETNYYTYLETKAFTIGGNNIETRFENFMPDIEFDFANTDSTNTKQLRMYSKVWKRDVASEALRISYSKIGIDAALVNKTLRAKDSFRPSRLDDFVLDENFFDNFIHSRFLPKRNIDKNGEFAQLVISNYVEAPTGNERWTLHGLQLKAHPSKEV